MKSKLAPFLRPKKEPFIIGGETYFFCKGCGEFLGLIKGWEFRGFANGLRIDGMDLCIKCAKKKVVKTKGGG